MQRGTITILIILGVAVAAATASVVYHYSNQKHAQQFWGTTTAKLIGNPSPVEVLELSKPDGPLSLEADTDDPPAEASEEKSAEQKAGAENAAAEPAPPTIKAFEFNGTPWVVTATKDAIAAKGINNLRRALVLDTTYNWSETAPPGDPQWKYGLAMTDQRDWVTVLFDFETRQIALAGGRKTAVLNPEASAEFQQFFAGQFAAEKTPADSPAADTAKPEASQPEPATTP
jgi:hypothetical protein